MQKNAEISARLVQLIESHQVSTNKYATLLGYKRAQVLYDAINKGIIGYDLLKRIADMSADINMSWFLTGNGEMLISGDSSGVEESREQVITALEQCLECKKKDDHIAVLMEQLRRMQRELEKYEKDQDKSKQHSA